MADLSAHERLHQRVENAASASSRSEIESFFQDTAKDVLLAFASNPHLEEHDLLRLLERKDLGREVVAEIAQREGARRNPAVQLALVRHPRTPRQISVPLMKFLHVFDLLRVAQTPAVPADIKMVAEQTLLKKISGMPLGEKVSMARRGTGRVAAELLMSAEPEIIRAGLENPYLTEANLLTVLARNDLPSEVVEQLALHPRWSQNYDLRLALIRHPETPLARVLGFLPDIAVTDLRNICLDQRMMPQVRSYVETHCASRLKRQHRLAGE